MRRNGEVDFVHVRNEEYGAFAAVAEARLTGRPVAVCGTAGPGVVHLINGMIDARREGVPLIVLAGDTEQPVPVLPVDRRIHRTPGQSPSASHRRHLGPGDRRIGRRPLGDRDPRRRGGRGRAGRQLRGEPTEDAASAGVLVDPHAISLPSHIPARTAEGFTLSAAKEVLHGRLDDVIETATRNVRLL
jgi:hypothetical protein